MTGPKRILDSHTVHARRRAADAPPMLVALDTTGAAPLHRQVYDGLRDAILAGRIAPGARLPSTRTLAVDLGVARNTVTFAYDQLRAEGYLVGRRGGGTRVRSVVPDELLAVHRPRSERGRASRVAAADSRAPRTSSTTKSGAVARKATSLSTRGAALAAAGVSIARRCGTPPVPFRLGVPAIDEFPSAIWARLVARRWRRGAIALGDGDVGGDPALRAAVADYLTNARGARCTADQIILVSGTHQALDLVARVLLDPDEIAWLEDPGYGGARATLDAAGVRVVPVPVDDEGIDVAAGERLAPDARLAYVTPSHQFPLGVVMSAARRLALLAWARRTGAWIVEDDYDSEFRYAGHPLPCLQGLDAEQRAQHDVARVLYTGTFSKTLVPGLRLAYLVVPPELVDDFRSARAATDRHPPTITQGVLADFIVEGHYARHVRRVRALYADRQAALIDAVDRRLHGLLTIAPHSAGLHLVGWLASRVSDVSAASRAREVGVEVFPLSRFAIAPNSPSAQGALVFGYAGFRERDIKRAVDRMAGALDTLRV